MISERTSFICECFIICLAIRILVAQQSNKRLINCGTISNDTVQYTCRFVNECHNISPGVIHICEQEIRNRRQYTKICCPEARKIPQNQRQPPIKDSAAVVKAMCKIYSEARYRNATFENPKYGENDFITRKILDCFEKESLIVGGQDAGEKEFPHMALIGYGNNANDIDWRCGGSLISEYFVLSAAHCVADADANWVRLGDLNYLSSDDDDNSLTVRIAERIVHPNFRPPLIYNDIVLFKLERKVIFNAYVRPTCLHTIPTVTNIKENPLISGWGKTGTDEGVMCRVQPESVIPHLSTKLIISFKLNIPPSSSEIFLLNFLKNVTYLPYHLSSSIDKIGESESSKLLKASVTFASDETCRQAYGNERSLSNGFDSKSMVCVLDKSGKDSCSGDSGGPLQIHNKDYSPCMYDQIGIVSLGSSFCGDGKTPAIYTKVANYIDWIQKHVWP